MKIKKLIIVLISIFIIIGIFIFSNIYISKKCLQITDETITTKAINNDIRITFLTDLHNSEFGKDYEKLAAKVASESPDIICFSGDLLNSDEKDTEHATDVIKKLSTIAPLYVSFGNQEANYQSRYKVDLKKLYEGAGAIVLERDWIDTEINGQQVRIGGIYGYCQTIKDAQETKREDETEYLLDFQNTDRYKILMCHMPLCWLGTGSLYEYQIDLVLCGHVHGGQVRIPFVGGLWAPDQGWFPGEECGVYKTNKKEWDKFHTSMLKWAENQETEIPYYMEDQSYYESYMVLSRGLGSNEKIPRFNNRPEIMNITIEPEE